MQLRDRDRSASCRRTSRACSPAPPAAATQFDIEPQGASIYVHGNPAANDPTVRQLERDTAAMTEPARPVQRRRQREDRELPGRRARAARPAHADVGSAADADVHAVPEAGLFLLDHGTPNVGINTGFAYDHGYYSPNIDITWVGMAGQGVAVNGVDGPQPAQGNQPQRPGVDEDGAGGEQGRHLGRGDRHPADDAFLPGLTDDYQSDGHVITQALRRCPPALAATAGPGRGLRPAQLERRPVRDRHADRRLERAGIGLGLRRLRVHRGAGDARTLADDRDRTAARIKQMLAAVAAGTAPAPDQVQSSLNDVNGLLQRAHALAGTAGEVFVTGSTEVLADGDTIILDNQGRGHRLHGNPALVAQLASLGQYRITVVGTPEANWLDVANSPIDIRDFRIEPGGAFDGQQVTVTGPTQRLPDGDVIVTDGFGRGHRLTGQSIPDALVGQVVVVTGAATVSNAAARVNWPIRVQTIQQSH